MRTASFIAFRYLFSKKSRNVINVISGISVTGIALSVAAMIIILSAINGLEALIGDVFSRFDPDIRITSTKGKTFRTEGLPIDLIKKTEGVKAVSLSVEEIGIIRHNDLWMHGTLKGVDTAFIDIASLREQTVAGYPEINDGEFFYIMVGGGIGNRLEIYPDPEFGELPRVTLFAPARNKKIKVNSQPFNSRTLAVSGVFSTNPDYDIKYVLLPRAVLTEMLEYKDEVSSIEISIDEAADEQGIKAALVNILGNNDFAVKTRVEQNDFIYKVSQTEKWFTFAILSFVLLLTSFNIIASLTMLVIEKKKDLFVLKSMGATGSFIRRIFFLEGIYINLLGAIIGMSIGLGTVWAQSNFKLIKMEGAIIDHYPVQLKSADFIAVTLVVLMVGALCSWLPVRHLVERFRPDQKKALT